MRDLSAQDLSAIFTHPNLQSLQLDVPQANLILVDPHTYNLPRLISLELNVKTVPHAFWDCLSRRAFMLKDLQIFNARWIGNSQFDSLRSLSILDKNFDVDLSVIAQAAPNLEILKVRRTICSQRDGLKCLNLRTFGITDPHYDSTLFRNLSHLAPNLEFLQIDGKSVSSLLHCSDNDWAFDSLEILHVTNYSVHSFTRPAELHLALRQIASFPALRKVKFVLNFF